MFHSLPRTRITADHITAPSESFIRGDPDPGPRRAEQPHLVTWQLVTELIG